MTVLLDLPVELIEKIILFLNEDDINMIINFRKYLSMKNLKFLLKDVSIDEQCKLPNLDVIKYLFYIGKNCTTNALDNAAINGHLDILKYLHYKGKKCQKYNIDEIAVNGHLDIIKYLISININCSVPVSICYRINNKNFHVFKYLSSINQVTIRNIFGYVYLEDFDATIENFENNLKK